MGNKNTVSKLLINVEPMFGNLDAQVTKFEQNIKHMQDAVKDFDIGGEIQNQLNNSIQKIQELKKEYHDGVQEMSKGKLDTSEFNNFAKDISDKIEDLQSRVLTLESDFAKLNSEISKFDGFDKFREKMEETREGFAEFKKDTQNALETMKEFNKVMNSSYKNKELKNLEKSIKALGAVDFDPAKNIKASEKDFEVINKNLGEMYDKYMDLSDLMSKNKKNPRVLHNVQDQISELLPKMAEMVMQIAKIKNLNLDAIMEEKLEIGSSGWMLGTIAQDIIDDSDKIKKALMGRRRMLKREIDAVTDASASGFMFKDGGIQIPVNLDDEAQQIVRTKIKNLIEDLDQYSLANPVNITLRFRQFKGDNKEYKEFNNDLKNLQASIASTDDPQLKKNLKSIYNSVSGQFKKAAKLQFTTNLPDVASDVDAAITKIEKAVKRKPIPLNTKFNISDKEQTRVQNQLNKLQKAFTIDITKNVKEMADSLKGLLDTKDTDKWVKAFSDGLKDLDKSITPLKELIDSFNKLSGVDKKDKNKVINQEETNLLLTFTESIRELQGVLESFGQEAIGDSFEPLIEALNKINSTVEIVHAGIGDMSAKLANVKNEGILNVLLRIEEIIKNINTSHVDVKPEFNPEAFITDIEQQLTRPAQVPITPIIDGVGQFVLSMQQALDDVDVEVKPNVTVNKDKLKIDKEQASVKEKIKNTQEAITAETIENRKELEKELAKEEKAIKKVNKNGDAYKRHEARINELKKILGISTDNKPRLINKTKKQISKEQENTSKLLSGEVPTGKERKYRTKKQNASVKKEKKTLEEQIQETEKYLQALPNQVKDPKTLFENYKDTFDILKRYSELDNKIFKKEDELASLREKGLTANKQGYTLEQIEEYVGGLKEKRDKYTKSASDILAHNVAYMKSGDISHLQDISKIVNNSEFSEGMRSFINNMVNDELSRISKSLQQAVYNSGDAEQSFDILKRYVKDNIYPIDQIVEQYDKYKKKYNGTRDISELSDDKSTQIALQTAYAMLSKATGTELSDDVKTQDKLRKEYEKTTGAIKENTKAKKENSTTPSVDKSNASKIKNESKVIEENTKKQNENTKERSKREQIRDAVFSQKYNGAIDLGGVSNGELQKIFDNVMEGVEKKNLGVTDGVKLFKEQLNNYKKNTQEIKQEQKFVNEEQQTTNRYLGVSEDYLQQCLGSEQAWLKRCKEGSEAYKKRLATINEIKEAMAAIEKHSNSGKQSNQNNLSSGTTTPSTIDEITQAEDRMGNEAQEATDQARQGLAKMREEVEKTNEALESVVYHYGALDGAKKGSKSHTFGDEIHAYYSGNRNGGRGWADGTGTYVTSDPDQLKKAPKNDPFKKFYAIDTSKLKLYEAHVEEDAQAYYEFAHKLEQYCIKMGSGFQGFDENLKGIDPHVLYESVQKLFKDSTLTFDEFNAFLNNMAVLVKESGMAADGSVNASKMYQFKKKNGSDDIKTRFLKSLGFQGTNFSGTSYDTVQSGSVIFDIDEASIIKSGKTINDVMVDIKDNAEQASEAVRNISNETPDLSDNGKKQGESYTEGIESTKSDAETAGADLANAANEGTAKAQDSKSPSKVAEKLGEYWGEGYAIGIKKHKGDVEAAVRELVTTGILTTEDLQKDLDTLLSGGFGRNYRTLKEPLQNILAETNQKSSANPKEISTAKGQLTKLFNELEHGEDFSPEQLDKFDERFAKWSNKLSSLGVDITDFTNRYSSIRLQYGESVDESLGKVKETIEEDSKVIETAEEKLATYLQFLVSRGKELLGDDVVDMVRQTRIKETKQGQFKAISYKVTGKSGSVTLDPYGQEVATRSQKFDDYTRHQQIVKTLVKEMDGYLSSVLNKEIQIGKARADGNTDLADSLETQVKRDIELYEQNKNRLKELGEEKVLQEQIIKESVARKKQEDEINNTIASRNDKAKKEALKAAEKRLANEAKAQEKYEQQQIKDAQKRTDKDFAEMQKREYDELGAKIKEYIALRKTIAKGEGLEEDIEKVQKLQDEIVDLNVKLKASLLFNGDLETKAMTGMDAIDEEVRRIEEGVTRKEQEIRSKAYERLSGKLQSAQYDIGFELENGGHTAKFNEELKEIQSELIAINNIEIDVVTQQEIVKAQKLLERVREIRKEGKLTSNKQANENSLQKNLAQVNSMLSGNTKLAFKRTDVYKELMRLQTLFKSFDTSRPQAELAELTTRLLQTKAKFDALANSVKGQNLFQTFLERIHGTTAQLVAQYLSWMDIIRYARTAINSIVELDTALVDLRKTTKMSATELDQFYFTSNEIAKQLGVTTSEVISQAAAWSRFNKIDPLYGNI